MSYDFEKEQEPIEPVILVSKGIIKPFVPMPREDDEWYGERERFEEQGE